MITNSKMADKIAGPETLQLAITQPFINIDTSFFTELCVMAPDVSCRSLTQIRLQISRWRTKWQPRKGMAVSQPFKFNFKCYSILLFAVCQLLDWAFLLYGRSPLSESRISTHTCHTLCAFAAVGKLVFG